MWIKLHFYQSGDEVFVQTQNICAVYQNKKGQGKVTCVRFIGDKDNWMLAKETPDEIGAMITE